MTPLCAVAATVESLDLRDNNSSVDIMCSQVISDTCQHRGSLLATKGSTFAHFALLLIPTKQEPPHHIIKTVISSTTKNALIKLVKRLPAVKTI